MKKLFIISLLVLASLSLSYATISEGRVSITDTATLIVSADISRRALWLMNTGTKTVYIGTTSSVNTTYPKLLPNGSHYIDSREEYKGAFYGICASTETSTISYSVR